jgi:two-component system response regulator (stage 0 sporulation protein A)
MLTRVLIVDDCLDLRKLMSDYLGSQEGISVIGEASNGIEALKILSEEEVDIILLDISMPQMDGFTMLQEMRSIPVNPNMNVIVVTALAGEVNVKRAIDLGVCYYMAKPFDIKALLEKIREAAARSTSYKEPIHYDDSKKETMDE